MYSPWTPSAGYQETNPYHTIGMPGQDPNASYDQWGNLTSYQTGGTSPWAYPGNIPDYVKPYDPNSMSMSDFSQPKIDAIRGSNYGALDQYTKEATRSGPSAWAGLANNQQDFMADQAHSNAAGNAASGAASAKSDLAMRGGLDSGAAERVGMNANNALLDSNQKINSGTAGNKMQIGMNDEQNRISQLAGVPGMTNSTNQADLDKLKLTGQAKQMDIQNAMGNNQGQNAYNMSKYQTQMGGWAAGQQANATQHSGK